METGKSYGPRNCDLWMFGGCWGPLEKHHIINKSHTVGNDAARKATEREELMADVCHYHNSTRFADTKKARAALLRQKALRYGVTHMREVLEAIPWKVTRRDITFDALVGLEDTWTRKPYENSEE